MGRRRRSLIKNKKGPSIAKPVVPKPAATKTPEVDAAAQPTPLPEVQRPKTPRPPLAKPLSKPEGARFPLSDISEQATEVTSAPDRPAFLEPDDELETDPSVQVTEIVAPPAVVTGRPKIDGPGRVVTDQDDDDEEEPPPTLITQRSSWPIDSMEMEAPTPPMLTRGKSKPRWEPVEKEDPKLDESQTLPPVGEVEQDLPPERTRGAPGFGSTDATSATALFEEFEEEEAEAYRYQPEEEITVDSNGESEEPVTWAFSMPLDDDDDHDDAQEITLPLNEIPDTTDCPPTEEFPTPVMEDLAAPHSAPMNVPEPPPIPGILDRYTPAPVMPAEGQRQHSDERPEPTPTPTPRLAPELDDFGGLDDVEFDEPVDNSATTRLVIVALVFASLLAAVVVGGFAIKMLLAHLPTEVAGEEDAVPPTPELLEVQKPPVEAPKHGEISPETTPEVEPETTPEVEPE
ncbi:MAG: hypothetical protein HN348_19750, partial [Proteobacteria bacterium]|nr:hypothetical protein [Pseudomonadota bacterium]